MPASALKKNKIVLSDYNYQRDIENRLFMAELSAFEVDLIKEILNSSVSFSLSQLTNALDTTASEIEPILKKLAVTKLLTRQGDRISIDKEMRKYYEFQIEKFDDDFQADIEFILASLSKVPIHILPSWYAISRTSDNIYASIIEKHLQTPKMYERYLQEINFEDPILTEIMNDVFSAPDFKIQSSVLREKYSLTKEQFEEYMLVLEYSFVCYLSYNKIGDVWKEVVTPFHEWREYLRLQKNSSPKPIEQQKISRTHSHDFAFMHDLNALLKACLKAPLPLNQKKGIFTLSSLALSCPSSDYLKNLLDKSSLLKLTEVRDSRIHALTGAESWIKKTIQEQAMTLYRHPLNRIEVSYALFTEKNVREIERNLKRVVNIGWIKFSDFMAGFFSPIGNAEPIILKNKGKRWRYATPEFSIEENRFIEAIIFERLFQVGVVAVGTYEEQPCFCITPFGRLLIGE